MATSAVEPEHNRTAGTDRPHSSNQRHRRRLLSHLHVQVPVPASSGWSGRPSGPASAPCNCNAHASTPAHHQDHRPASPSLLRSPTAWIRSKGHGFWSSKHHHTPRRSGNLYYDARSYAQNFDEGGRGREAEDALKQHRYLSPGLLMSPRQVSPSSQGTSGGRSSNGEEPVCEGLRVME